MSVSPAMLNRAKRVSLRPIVCHFERNEYTTFLPSKPFISVQKFLEAFAQNNIKTGNFEYTDLELVKHKKLLSYDYLIQKESFHSKYDIYFSELTQETFTKKLNIAHKYLEQEVNDLYPRDEVNEEGKSDVRRKNFFTYLVDRYPIYKIDESNVKNKTNLQNIFNSDTAIQKREEFMKEQRNQWLYNRNTFPNLVTPLNVQSWDPFYNKNTLTQILGTAIGEIETNVDLDMDKTVKGIHTREKQVDFLISNKSTGMNIPLNIVEEIDEVEQFDILRNKIYNYYLPKDYPNFLYEKIDPTNPIHLTEDVLQKVDKINKKYFNQIKNEWKRQMAYLMEQRSFKNFDALKIMSRSRFNMSRKIQIGLSAYNDKLRFNLFKRNPENMIEDQSSLHRSPIFDLEIQPGETTIKNLVDFKNFLEIFRTINSLNPELIESAYDDFLLETRLLDDKWALKMEKQYRLIEFNEGIRQKQDYQDLKIKANI